jgi:hypothetical protein
VPLNNPLGVSERILAFGPQGSAKTSHLLSIARFAKLSGSDAIFYIADTDAAFPRMLVGQYAGLDNIRPMGCYTWPDLERFATTVAQARPQDWISLDFIGTAWQMVQDHFTREVFNQQPGNYFLEVRKAQGKDTRSSLGAFEGWVDWPVINALYRQTIHPILFQSVANVYATCKVDDLSSEKKPTEDTTTRQLFARFNVKPVGQKDLPYQFHTVLLTGRDAHGGFTLNTIKDREREEVRGLVVTNFVTDYLVKIGGWKLG